jgi:hypothetical protein
MPSARLQVNILDIYYFGSSFRCSSLCLCHFFGSYFSDNGTPNLCNNWSGSKLFINLKHPVVERFRAR